MEMNSSFMLWPLCPPGKESCYPLDRRFIKPQIQSGYGGEEKRT